MASENNEIGDIVKKCKILLLDVEGTTTSISFVKDILFPYAEANVQEFLQNQWENDDVKGAVEGLRKLAIEDEEKKVEGVIAIPGEDAGKEEQIEGLVKNVMWLMSGDRKVGPLKQLQGLIWKQGYANGEIKGHVYDDVAPALELWNSTEGQKVYIYSSGSVQAQKLLFNQSVAGDLLPHIEGHFDTAVGGKQEAASYATIAEKIGCKPDEILFLTDIVKEAEAARAAGLQVALVSREGNAPLPAEPSYPVLHSFDQLAVTNKRKPDPQEEEVPAKVLKTDIEADVKTSSEVEVNNTSPENMVDSHSVASSEAIPASDDIPVEATSKEAEPEKMDVEEEVLLESVSKSEADTEKVSEEVPVQVETIIEEVTNPIEAGNAPVCEIDPVIEENVEKTDKNETEAMETESTENVETVAAEPNNVVEEKIDEQSPPIAEETPPAVIIDIQDVTNEQQMVNEEVIDDLVPVVEEPPTIEMEELKNVGEVLDKECDEILLKVQDITNIDNIPVKPLLNTIAEESIDAENGENTNDIVESILDSEMELNEKPCDDIDINSVQEITDIKTDVDEKAPENGVEAAGKIAEKQSNNSADKTEEIVGGNEAKNMEEKSSTEVLEKDVKQDVLGEIAVNTVSESNVAVETKMSTADTCENKLDAKESPVVSEDSKMESEASTVQENVEETKENVTEPVENNLETKKSDPEPLENKIDIKDSVPVDTEMETSESTATTVKVSNKSEERTEETVETKSETKESVTEQEDNKMESEDISESVENKIDESIPQTSNKIELVQNKSETNETIPEQTSNKMESVENNGESVPKKVIDKVETETAPVENEMEVGESTPQESKSEEGIVEPEPTVSQSKETENEKNATPQTVSETATESKESSLRDVEMETETTEKQINGNSNGETEVNQNGDASKDEELSSRLSVENGENGKDMNGANGNVSAEEKGQGDNKVETEIPDIKVKTVTSEEPRPDPIEQPVEA